MTPVRRLTLAGVGVIAGGTIVAAGSRATWASATVRPSPVDVPGFPRVVLAGGRVSLDAAALGAGYLFGLGLLIAIVPLGWLVAGPRVRVVLAALAVGVAVGVLAGAATTREDLPARAARVIARELAFPGAAAEIASGPAIATTSAGAALAALAAAAGGVAGRGVPRLRLPEGDVPDGGPDAPPEDGGE